MRNSGENERKKENRANKANKFNKPHLTCVFLRRLSSPGTEKAGYRFEAVSGRESAG
jgi:hypothetical protein